MSRFKTQANRKAILSKGIWRTVQRRDWIIGLHHERFVSPGEPYPANQRLRSFPISQTRMHVGLDLKEIVRKLQVAMRPLDTDTWIYRLVVLFLRSLFLVTVLGAIYLTAVAGTGTNFQILQGTVAIGSAAVGALAGYLLPLRSKVKGEVFRVGLRSVLLLQAANLFRDPNVFISSRRL